MAAPTNIITAADIDAALSQEFIQNFTGEFDRLAELMGIFGVSTRAAGVALYQYTVSGALNNAAGADSSSGTAYVEGDEVALSKYTVTRTPIGDLSPVPYRKMTTAKAILQDGYEKAVLATDAKMLAQIRAQIINQFFVTMANGTATQGTATIAGLQECLALMDAKVLDNMQTNGDETDAALVHFVNRQDIAAYLANAAISTQTAFGMTYIQNFLGVQNIFVTNKVASGTAYATSAANIHAYGIDFAELSQGGLVYQTESNGIIGVAHKGAYDHASAETDVMCGLQLVPENTDYIGKFTFTPDA